MEFEEFIRKMPKFTKLYMAVVLGFAILTSVGVLNYFYLLLDFEKVFYNF